MELIKDIVICGDSSPVKVYTPHHSDIVILELMSEKNKMKTIGALNSDSGWKYAALIVETRKNHYLFDIIKQTLLCLPDYFALYIIGSEGNYEWLEYMAKHHSLPTNRYSIWSIAGVCNISIKGYNELMLSPKFWKMIEKSTDYVLIFQPDGFPLQPGIKEFLDYDYIGAAWNSPPKDYKTEDIPNTNNCVGNGGLSFRSVKRMIDALEKFPPRSWLLKNFPEDVYYSTTFEQMKFNIASKEIAMKFSHESVYSDLDTFGSHCGWRHHPKIKEFIERQISK